MKRQTIRINSGGLKGGNCGDVRIHGSKNSLLNTIFLPLSIDRTVKFNNIPEISDITTNINILEKIGAHVENTERYLTVNCRDVKKFDLSIEDAPATTGSKFLIPLLTNRFGEIRTYPSGGDNIGDRGFQNYVNLIQRFGVDHEINSDGSYLFFQSNKFSECVALPFPSFGLTVLAFICAMRHGREFQLKNISIEPEIISFLETAELFGFKSEFTDIRNISVFPIEAEENPVINNPFDRNVAVTLSIAAIAKQRDIKLINVSAPGLGAFFDFMNSIGIPFELRDNQLSIYANEANFTSQNSDISFHIFPSMHSDWNAMISVLLTQIPGKHRCKELLFEDRMQHWKQLSLMNVTADRQYSPATRLTKGLPSCYKFHGPQELRPARLFATDLRCGAALNIAASLAAGTSYIENYGQIDRGYEDLPFLLSQMFEDFEYNFE